MDTLLSSDRHRVATAMTRWKASSVTSSWHNFVASVYVLVEEAYAQMIFMELIIDSKQIGNVGALQKSQMQR
eukprot:2684962-Amphidinium_carterae.1